MKKILRIIGAFVIACCGVLGFSACGDGEAAEIADNTKYYDDITKTLRLTRPYAGKSFFTDGIGEAKLTGNIDGDTTNFSLVVGNASGDAVTIRYYSIDTPESTGGVEKWGKAASQFTKLRLDAATEIVLEASETPAVKDGYGTRYLGYVWYKRAEDSDFRNLNLEIVENGYSENKGVKTSAFPYNEYFSKANNFAKSIELRIYSKLDDPLYNPNPIDTTVKEFNEHPELFYIEELDAGYRIRFTAYLSELKISSTGTYTFTAEQYDPETGKVYKLNVYAGYINAAESGMELGHLYQIVGSVQKHFDSLQISGLSYSGVYKREFNTHVKQSDYYFTFDGNVKYSVNNCATLYSDLTVASASVADNVLTVVASAGKCKGTSANGNAYAEAVQFTLQAPVGAGYVSTLQAGDRISVHAYNFDSGEFDCAKDVLKILSVNDIVKK